MILEQILTGELAPDPHYTPHPIAFGNIPWYSIFIICGFIVAIVGACMKMWKRYKISVEPFYWFILIGVPFSILGARFGSCAIGQTPWGEFFVNFGQGLAVEWAVMFDFIIALIYFPLILKLPRYRVRDEFGPKPEVKKVSAWLYLDAIMPCVLIAQCIGRWGNYFNQEVYGQIVTSESLSWFLYKVFPGMYINGHWRQPLFLWEMLLNLAGFLLLYVGAEFIKVRKTGDLAAGYFVWYGIIRACLEPLRNSEGSVFYYKTSLIVSIVWAVLGVLFIVFNHVLISRYRHKKVFGRIVDKPINSIQNTFKKLKIKYLDKRIEKADHDKINYLKSKRVKVENKLIEINNIFKQKVENKFERTEQEKLYFGRW